MSNEDEQKIANEKIALLITQRIRELRAKPVDETFDISHLKEIHRRIFQDCPGLPYPEAQIYKPGEFRSPVPGGLYWRKKRPLKSTVNISEIYYSSMDTENVKRLETILKNISIEKALKLPEDEFKLEMGVLYAKIDQIHPFHDGNSRTLREFTSQLAQKAKYEIEWSRFDSEAGHELLYIARDLSVNKITLECLTDEKEREVMQRKIALFEKYPDMPALMFAVVRKLEEPEQEKNNADGQGNETGGTV